MLVTLKNILFVLRMANPAPAGSTIMAGGVANLGATSHKECEAIEYTRSSLSLDWLLAQYPSSCKRCYANQVSCSFPDMDWSLVTSFARFCRPADWLQVTALTITAIKSRFKLSGSLTDS